jgi:branched-chain amino acid transport system substrate-binding protein
LIAVIRLRPFLLAAAALAARSALAAPPVRGVTDTEVIFGITAGFSGTSRELAQSMKVGIDVAFAEANAAGGVHGRMLRLIGADHANNPAKAAELAKDLVEQKNVFLLTGNTGSGSIERQLPYLIQQRVILFGTVSGADFLRNDPPDRYVFNFRPGYAEEVLLAIRHLVEVRRIKPNEIAYFGQEDSFGDSGWKGFSKALRRFGKDPSKALRTGYRLNTVDVNQAVHTIRANASRLRAVVTCGTHKQVAALIGKLQDLRLVFTNVSSVDANELADDLMEMGPNYAEGVIVTQVVPVPTSAASAVMRYRERLHQFAPSTRPDFLSLQSYLSTLILVEGLRRAGRDLSTEKLVEALESIRSWDIGLGALVSFGPSQHDASHRVWGTVLARDGSVKNLDLEVE